MNLSYPWNAKSIKAQQNIIAQIWGDLYNNNPKCLKYRDEVPDKRILTMLDEVYDLIDKGKWVIVGCNSIKLLQIFAEVMPMVYSFTSHKYSYLTDTENLINVIDGKSKKDFDNELRSSLSEMEKLRLYPLLLWDNMTANHRWSQKYSGEIMNIFQARVKGNAVFVTTHLYTGSFLDNMLPEFLNTIAELWGQTLSDTIDQMSQMLFYNIKDQKRCGYLSRDL